MSQVNSNKRARPNTQSRYHKNGSDSSSEYDSDQSSNNVGNEITFDSIIKPNKKLRHGATGNSVTSSSDSDSSDDITHIDIEFEFRDPCNTDWYSIKALLTPYYIQPIINKHIKPPTTKPDSSDPVTDPTVFDTGEFSRLLGEQAECGTLIHADGMENQPVGILTVISLNRYIHKYTIQQIINYVIYNCTDINARNTIESILYNKSNHCGLIVNERMLNTPTELIAPLHNSLLQDIEFAQSQSPDQYNFTHYIMISKCYYPQNNMTRKNINKRKHNKQQHTGTALYHKFEEQYYIEHSLLNYNFHIEINDTTNNAQEIQSRVIGIIHAKQLTKIVKHISTLFGVSDDNTTQSSKT